jgi:cobalt/nickel transport system permease protein
MIDRYAYSTPLRRLDPAYKAGLSLTVLGMCLVLNRPTVGLAVIVWMLILSLFWARHPGWLFAKILFAEGAFLALSVIGVAVNINVHPFSIGITHQGVEAATLLFARALGCAAALNFLSLTTPSVDLIDLGHRLRLPPILLDLMTLIYRFIFTLLESLERMRNAQEARLGYSGWRQSLNSAALLTARLLVDAYQRSSQTQIALQGRGFTGDLKVLPGLYRRDKTALFLTALITLSLFYSTTCNHQP